jgi:uncharacterized coiled-coil protein SlyX
MGEVPDITWPAGLPEGRERTTDERLHDLERKQRMTEATVAELTEAVTTLTTAFNTFATDVNQTIADIEAKEAQGGTITAAELGPIKDSLTSLSTSVEAADATVKSEDPGPAQPTTETVSVSIDSAGEGSVQLPYAASRLTITSEPPASGTETLAAIEGEPEATKLTVTGATPESTVEVGISIAAQ